jgi:hypothetical protein
MGGLGLEQFGAQITLLDFGFIALTGLTGVG